MTKSKVIILVFLIFLVFATISILYSGIFLSAPYSLKSEIKSIPPAANLPKFIQADTSSDSGFFDTMGTNEDPCGIVGKPISQYINYSTATYYFNASMENVENVTKIVDYEMYVCRCDEKNGDPPGLCQEYFPYINDTGGGHIKDCLGLGRINVTLLPNQTKYFSGNVTQYGSMLCGSFQADLQMFNVNGQSCEALMAYGLMFLNQSCVLPACGNGILEVNETCEPPNSTNNHLCNQTNSTCLSNKTGTRNNFGNCNGDCGCTETPFNYSCKKGSCGAECAVDGDCTKTVCIDKCIGPNYYHYGAENNKCNEDCGCENNSCGVLNISYFDPRCCKDRDKDCVCDNIDKCPNSQAGEPVNAEGCDDFQFCKQFNCGSGCEAANFIPVMKNCTQVISSLEASPHDCTTVIIDTEGKLQPNCFPTTCAG